MKNNPLISIIVASYNYENYIKETLESLIKQTYDNFEVIVIDDGSSDNSVDFIKEFEKKDSRVKLYQHENGVNKGLDKTVKLGVRLAKGEYIAFCESDDSFREDYLEKKVEYIKKFPNVDIIANYPNMFGDEELIDFKTKEFVPLFTVLRSITKPRKIYFDLLKANEMVFATFSIVMVKASKLKKCDFNPPVIHTAIDIWLWKQLLLRTKVGFIDEKLSNWRLHKASVVQQKKEENWDEYWKALNKVLKINPIDQLKIFLLKNKYTKKPLTITCNESGVYIEIFGKIKTYLIRKKWFKKNRIISFKNKI